MTGKSASFWDFLSKRESKTLPDKGEFEGYDGEEELGQYGPMTGLASSMKRAIRPGTEGQFLMAFDDDNDKLLREYTVATEAPESWKESDEWKLIAQAVDTMRKNKIKRLLMWAAHAKDGKLGYKAWTGDIVDPKTKLKGGGTLDQLYFHGDGFEV